jgi:hypothetical protein
MVMNTTSDLPGAEPGGSLLRRRTLVSLASSRHARTAIISILMMLLSNVVGCDCGADAARKDVRSLPTATSSGSASASVSDESQRTGRLESLFAGTVRSAGDASMRERLANVLVGALRQCEASIVSLDCRSERCRIEVMLPSEREKCLTDSLLGPDGAMTAYIASAEYVRSSSTFPHGKLFATLARNDATAEPAFDAMGDGSQGGR